MEFIGKAVSRKELKFLNEELNKFKYNKKVYVNIGDNLYLKNKHLQSSYGDGWNITK